MFSVSILLTHFQTMPNFYYYSSDGKINVTGKELQELAKKGQILWDTVIENMAGKRTLAGNIKGLTFAETVQPKPQPTAPVPTAELSRDAAADLLRKFFKGGNDERKDNTALKVAHRAFKKWSLAHGYRVGLEIDRIDNNGNYEPRNCRWVTRKENLRNTSRTRWFTINGITKSLPEWCEIYNVSH